MRIFIMLFIPLWITSCERKVEKEINHSVGKVQPVIVIEKLSDIKLGMHVTIVKAALEKLKIPMEFTQSDYGWRGYEPKPEGYVVPASPVEFMMHKLIFDEKGLLTYAKMKHAGESLILGEQFEL